MTQYDRASALLYAHRWAYARNPRYFDYSTLGGDCTNFASQCLYTGLPVMNYTKTFGWYYQNSNQKSPSWTGVDYFYRYLTRAGNAPGPVAQEVPISQLEPGDFIQLQFQGMGRFSHTLIVVDTQYAGSDSILIATHTYDADQRPLSTYTYQTHRGLHILGAHP